MKFKKKNNIILTFLVIIFGISALNALAIEDPNKPFGIKKTNNKLDSSINNKTVKDKNNLITNSNKKEDKDITKATLNSPEIPLGQTISGILAVFVFIVIIVIIMKKYGNKLGIGNFTNNIITVKARQQLDSKNSVSVIKVYEDEYVLGVGANGITLLSKLTPIGESELFDNGEENNDDELQNLDINNSQQVNNTPFINQLQSFIGNKKHNNTEASSRSTYSAKLDNAMNKTVSLNISNQYNQQKDNNNNEQN